MRLLLATIPALWFSIWWAPQIVPSVVWAPAVALLVAQSIWGARGTYHLWYHVRDMTPWAISLWTVTLIGGNL